MQEHIKIERLLTILKLLSSNIGTVKDRIVEPFDFTTNYIHLWAFENSFSKNYLFRISRIEKVEVLDDIWINQSKHKIGKTDVFRMSGEREIPVELKLTTRGYNYLIEQYPGALKYINHIGDNEYIFNFWYVNYQGISKFILSSIDDVEIIYPDVLSDYMNNKIKNKKF